MDTRVTEVADGIHQLTTFVPDFPLGFNQYLIAADEPVLFHTGMRSLFPSVSAAVGTVVPAASMRWISFGHVEADESGAMNEWLELAPEATVVHGQTACMVSLWDLADRPPRPLDDGALLDVGGHVLRWIDTPHVPHGWESGLLFDTVTRTLFCGDLFTWFGDYGPSIADDLVGRAVAAEDAAPGSYSLHPSSPSVIRRLAALDVATLAPMHAPAFTGDCRAALLELADDVARRIEASASAIEGLGA